jgi:hypothetical protein
MGSRRFCSSNPGREYPKPLRMNGPQRVIGIIAILLLVLLGVFPPVTFGLPEHPEVVTGYGFAPAWRLPERSRVDWVLVGVVAAIDLLVCICLGVAIHPRRRRR